MGLTQEAIAIRAGIASPTFAVLERGFTRKGAPSNPTLDTVLRVLTALDSSAVESLTAAMAVPVASGVRPVSVLLNDEQDDPDAAASEDPKA